MLSYTKGCQFCINCSLAGLEMDTLDIVGFCFTLFSVQVLIEIFTLKRLLLIQSYFSPPTLMKLLSRDVTEVLKVFSSRYPADHYMLILTASLDSNITMFHHVVLVCPAIK